MKKLCSILLSRLRFGKPLGLSLIHISVVKMPDGGFWFGTRQGNVYAYDKNLEAASGYKMPYNYIYAASCYGDGKLWLGTRTMGLCIDGRWYHKMAGDTLSLEMCIRDRFRRYP